MPRVRRRGKERMRDLTPDQLFELLWGPDNPSNLGAERSPNHAAASTLAGSANTRRPGSVE